MQIRAQTERARSRPPTTIVSYDPALPREHHRAELDELLRGAAEHLSAGFLREGTTWGGDRSALEGHYPHVALLERLKASVWVSNHLERDYVYDAFVEQVMTSSQLAKTHHLHPDRWQVEDLGSDHHLVTHRRADLWLDQDPTPLADRGTNCVAGVVPPEVIAQARDDFGEAIMTTATLETHPPPVPPEEQARVLALYGLTPRR